MIPQNIRVVILFVVLIHKDDGCFKDGWFVKNVSADDIPPNYKEVSLPNISNSPIIFTTSFGWSTKFPDNDHLQLNVATSTESSIVEGGKDMTNNNSDGHPHKRAQTGSEQPSEMMVLSQPYWVTVPPKPTASVISNNLAAYQKLIGNQTDTTISTQYIPLRQSIDFSNNDTYGKFYQSDSRMINSKGNISNICKISCEYGIFNDRSSRKVSRDKEVPDIQSNKHNLSNSYLSENVDFIIESDPYETKYVHPNMLPSTSHSDFFLSTNTLQDIWKYHVNANSSIPFEIEDVLPEELMKYYANGNERRKNSNGHQPNTKSGTKLQKSLIPPKIDMNPTVFPKQFNSKYGISNNYGVVSDHTYSGSRNMEFINALPPNYLSNTYPGVNIENIRENMPARVVVHIPSEVPSNMVIDAISDALPDILRSAGAGQSPSNSDSITDELLPKLKTALTNHMRISLKDRDQFLQEDSENQDKPGRRVVFRIKSPGSSSNDESIKIPISDINSNNNFDIPRRDGQRVQIRIKQKGDGNNNNNPDNQNIRRTPPFIPSKSLSSIETTKLENQQNSMTNGPLHSHFEIIHGGNKVSLEPLTNNHGMDKNNNGGTKQVSAYGMKRKNKKKSLIDKIISHFSSMGGKGNQNAMNSNAFDFKNIFNMGEVFKTIEDKFAGVQSKLDKFKGGMTTKMENAYSSSLGQLETFYGEVLPPGYYENILTILAIVAFLAFLHVRISGMINTLSPSITFGIFGKDNNILEVIKEQANLVEVYEFITKIHENIEYYTKDQFPFMQWLDNSKETPFIRHGVGDINLSVENPDEKLGYLKPIESKSVLPENKTVLNIVKDKTVTSGSVYVLGTNKNADSFSSLPALPGIEDILKEVEYTAQLCILLVDTTWLINNQKTPSLDSTCLSRVMCDINTLADQKGGIPSVILPIVSLGYGLLREMPTSPLEAMDLLRPLWLANTQDKGEGCTHIQSDSCVHSY